MDRLYVVIYSDNGRIQNCGHKHPGIEEAHACSRGFESPEVIMEWQEERQPQWMEHAVSAARKFMACPSTARPSTTSSIPTRRSPRPGGNEPLS